MGFCNSEENYSRNSFCKLFIEDINSAISELFVQHNISPQPYKLSLLSEYSGVSVPVNAMDTAVFIRINNMYVYAILINEVREDICTIG